MATRYLYKQVDPDTFVRYDSETGTYSTVPASAVPRLRLSTQAPPPPSREGDTPPSDTSVHHDDVYAAMLDFQRRAHEAGDPESAAPYLETLAGMLDDPEQFDEAHKGPPELPSAPRGAVRMSWTAVASRPGSKWPFKAVGQGPDAGKVRYGAAAQSVIQNQDKRGGRSHVEQTIYDRAAEKRSGAAASKILTQIHSGDGITREHLEALATHLPALGPEQLNRARVLLEASWGGKKLSKQAKRDALMNHVRKLVDGADANLPGHAGRLAREKDQEWGDWAEGQQQKDDAATGAWAAGQKPAPKAAPVPAKPPVPKYPREIERDAAPAKPTPAPAEAGGSGPDKAPWEMSPDELKKSGVKFFRTGQGSLYALNPKTGQTIRVKTPHVGHDAKDVGLKRASEQTVYMDPENAKEVGLWQSSSAEGKRIVVKGGHAHLVSRNARTGQYGLDKKLPVQTQPQKGLSPLELNDRSSKEIHPSLAGGTVWKGNHPGSPITEDVAPEAAHGEFVRAAQAKGLKTHDPDAGATPDEPPGAALAKEALGAPAEDLPEPPPGKLFDAGDEPARSEHAKAALDLADHARRRMPGVHIDAVPAGAPLTDHLEALASIDRHARGLGIERANYFGDLADHVHKTLADVREGRITPEEARENAEGIGRGEFEADSPNGIAHELRSSGHHDAALFYERQAHKAEKLAQAAIEEKVGKAPGLELELDERPAAQSVAELEARMREEFAKPGADPQEAFNAALRDVPGQVRGDFFRQHKIETDSGSTKGYYRAIAAAQKKFGPQAETGASAAPPVVEKPEVKTATKPAKKANKVNPLEKAPPGGWTEADKVPPQPAKVPLLNVADVADTHEPVDEKTYKTRGAAEAVAALHPGAGVVKSAGAWLAVAPKKPAPEAPAQPAGGTAALSDEAFAQKVQQVADAHPHGFGGYKTFISDVFDKLKEEDPALDRAEFDRRLLAANASDRLSLSRADLVQLMHPDDVSRSEVKHPAGVGEFHFVVNKNPVPKTNRGPGTLEEQQARHNAAARESQEKEAARQAEVRAKLYGKNVDNGSQNDRLNGDGAAHPEPTVPHDRLDQASEGTAGGRVPAGQPVGADAPPAPGAAVPRPRKGTRKGSGTVPPGEGGGRAGADAPDADGGDAGRRGGGVGTGGSAADAPGGAGPAGGVGDGKRGGGLDGRGPAIPDPTPAEAVVQEPPTPENPTDLAAGNFRYTSTDFALGGPRQKFNGNLAAIRTLQAIKAEGRTQATPEEQAILSRYVGWGQFKALMNDYGDHDGENAREWDAERKTLKGLLTPEEYDAARASIKNAHYTAPAVVDAHWKMAQRLGFSGGRFLETSAGVGYYLGLMPPEMAGRTRATAVELDPTTAGIAKLLYPAANVQNQGFEEHQSPDHFYDLVASNVPFGDYGVHDPRYNKHQANIHDYFFLKSADKVRHGGLVMHITSAGTMDKLDPSIRDELAKTCDLVSAIRFPGGAHKKNAGTEVVTDMLILRKRHPGEEPSGPDWSGTTTVPDPDGGEPIVVNKYFAEHPEQILGRLDRSGKLYQGDSKGVSATDDYEDRLKAAIERLPQGLLKPQTAPPQRFAPEVLPAPGKVKNGGYHLGEGGKLYVRRGGESVEQTGVDKATADRIAGHLGVRDALRAVFNEQAAGREGAEARVELNRVYDAFVKKFGPINSPANRRAFMTDPDASPLAALEKYDPKTKKATKADIFFKHVGRSYVRATSAADVGEGVGISLHETGAIDLNRVGQLLKRPAAEVGKELTERGIAFENPGKGWEPAGHYLAGNVRQKLVEARAAAAADPKYAPNVAALEAVQPPDLDHTEIKVKLGAPWVPAADVTRFAAEVLGGRDEHFDVNYLPQTGWSASYSNEGKRRFRDSGPVNEAWGVTSRGRTVKRFDDLLEAALNNSAVKVTYTDGDATYTDREATDKAMAKVQELRDRFAEWVWEDDDRRRRLHRFYNDNFNNVRPIKYDGSHQKFPGMNPAVTLRPHQANAVWQIVTTGGGLLAHEVGTGKTKVMGAAAMELRRLGLAKKPCVVCKKANVEAVTREIQDLYPGAKILSTADNFDKKNRKAIVSQMATGDHDVVVMTHDQLDLLPMHPDVERAQIRAELKELAAVKASASAPDVNGKKKSKGNQLSDVEKAIARLEAKLKEIADPDKKDDAVYFEDTGIDHLLVDEAHRFKSLPIYSRMDRVKGVPSSRSEFATNMLHRARWLQQQNGGRGVTFLTGTPVPNALPELFTMQRFLQPGELKARGIDTFDAWAATFGNIETKMEFTATGEYKPVSRFRSYANVGDLSQVASGMLDVVKADPKHIVRPKREDHAVVAPKTAAVAAMMAQLADRAKKLKGKPEKGADNMAAIFTDGRKGSTDMRLLNAAAPDDPDSKTNQCVRNVLRLASAHPGATQLIFSDMGVNESKSGFNLYEDVIDKLVAGGIPREKIANFGELDGKKKEEAVEAMRRGDVIVGIGGTERLGTGVNVQHKIKALHHLDAPFRPADIEQRDGRGWRQGNMNDPTKPAHEQTVGIYRYVTEGSLDQLMWDIIARKKAGIDQVIRPGGTTARELQEHDEENLSPEQISAIASGNPHIQEKVQVDEDVRQLQNAHARHQKEQAKLRDSIAAQERQIPLYQKDAAEKRADAEAVAQHKEFALEIDGRLYADRKEASDALERKALATADRWNHGTHMGDFKGLGVYKVGEKIELRSKSGQRYQTGGSLPSIEYVANKRIALDADEADQHIANARADMERARGSIGKAFPKADELKAKAERQKRLEKILAGAALPDGYEEGQTVQLADGRRARLIQGQKDGRIEAEIDGKPVSLHADDLPPPGGNNAAPSAAPHGAVESGVMNDHPKPGAAPDYTAWDRLLASHGGDRPAAEKIARVTNVPIRPEVARAPLDTAALPERFRAARTNPALWDALAADLADVRVSRDDLNALAKLVSPEVYERVKRLPKAKQIELLRAHL